MSRSFVGTSGGAVRLTRAKWEVWTAVNQARRVRRSHPATVRICWDLDNTLVDSGTLIHAGRSLPDAIVEAQPVPNMLEFFGAMQALLPEAAHFILSARARSMRRSTVAWLQRHGLTSTGAAVCFVPRADAKPRVWTQLARDARLVIVDDLTYDHESDRPSVYLELVECAERAACVYIGLDQISQIAADSRAVEAVAAQAVDSLPR